MSTFNFGDARVNAIPEFADDLRDAVSYSTSKPDIALFKLRQVLERIVKRAYVHFTGQPLPDNATLSDLLAHSYFIADVPGSIRNAMHSVRETGNRAVHGEHVTSNDVARELQLMDQILRWTATWYQSRGANSLWHEAIIQMSTTSARGSDQRVVPKSPRATLLIVGAGITLAVIALIWLYVHNLDSLLNEHQRAWIQRQQHSSSSNRSPVFNDSPPLNSAALSNDAVVLTHPSLQQQNENRSDAASISSATAYPRNYPSSWPAPFFEEEIKPGEWGRWLEEPNWQQRNAGQDFIWYRSVEAHGIEESNEWSIQCEDGQGVVHDIGPGHNEQCELLHRIRIRNDWQNTAFVYYFAKSHHRN